MTNLICESTFKEIEKTFCNENLDPILIRTPKIQGNHFRFDQLLSAFFSVATYLSQDNTF